jgi:hypothetical protein
MYNPKAILDELLILFRAMPTLVTALGGDANVITIYQPRYPGEMDYAKRVLELAHPELLIVWRGTVQGVRGGGVGSVWQHNFAMPIGLPEEGAAPFAGYFNIWRAIVSGTPTTRTPALQIYYLNILPGAFMVFPPSIVPAFQFVGADHRIDYMEVQFSIQEAGENP